MRNFFFALFLFLFSALGAPEPAFAHATPLEYSPEASAILGALPDEVVIRFSERLDPRASNIAVFGPDGEPAHQGIAFVDSENRYVLRVRVSDAGRGTYAPSWSVVSADDGHFTKGAFVFSVGEETVVSGATFDIVHRSALAQGISVGVELFGYALLWGFLFAQIMAVALGRSVLDTSRIFSRLCAVLLMGVACIIAGNGAYIYIESQAFAAAQGLSFTQGLAIFIQTKAGMLAATRAICSLAVLGFLLKQFYAEDKSMRRGAIWFYAGAMIVFGYLRTLSSHGAAGTIFPAFTFFDHMVQLAAKQIWVGSVVVFALCIVPALVAGGAKETRRIFAYLSSVVFLAAGSVFASGAYIVWLDLKTSDNIFITDWGKRFISVSIISGVMLALRIWSWWSYERRLGAESGKHAKRLSFFLPLEACIGILMLGFSALAMMTTPPVAVSHTVLRTAESQGARIVLARHPYEDNTLSIEVVDSGQSSREDGHKIQKLTVFLTNTKEGIGPIVVPTFRRSENTFVIDARAFTPPGLWQIDIQAERVGKYDAVAEFDLDIPADRASSSGEVRSSLFTGVIFSGGLATAILCLILAHMAWRKGGGGADLERFANLENLHWKSAAFAALLIGVALGGGQVLIKSSFERDCVVAGNMWHVSVPIRGGMATSPLAVPGCMFGYGVSQFHFADEKEYRYFMKPAVVAVDVRYGPPVLREHTETAISIAISENGFSATDLVFAHERLLHVIIIGEDFETFKHIHPDDFGKITEEMKNSGKYSVVYHPMRAGRYLLAVDAQVRATPVTEYEVFNVEGTNPMASSAPDFATAKNFAGYDVEFQAPMAIKAGEVATISYHISKNGASVSDMVPYLGAPMHLAIVKDDFSSFMHTHGEVHGSSSLVSAVSAIGMAHMHTAPSKKFGPDVEAHVQFPTRGTYYIFGQFKHGESVILIKFAVQVY